MSISGVLFGQVPYKPPPYNPDEGWSFLDIVWTGHDGVDWHFPGPTFELKGGIVGFKMPKFTHYRDKSPAVPGSRYRGSSVEQRDLMIPLRMFNDSSTPEFVALAEAFYSSLNPRTPGRITVTSDGKVRSIACRFEQETEDQLDRDPTFFGWQDIGLEFIAEQPFWEGVPTVQNWEPPATKNFFAPAGSPDFSISRTSSTASALISNPGDEAAYPVWRITGPTTSVQITVGGQTLGVPFAVPAGTWVDIDTRPAAQTATDSTGTDRTGELTGFGFAAVPAGINQPFTIVLTGQGRVTATLTPLYWRAF